MLSHLVLNRVSSRDRNSMSERESNRVSVRDRNIMSDRESNIVSVRDRNIMSDRDKDLNRNISVEDSPNRSRRIRS